MNAPSASAVVTLDDAAWEGVDAAAQALLERWLVPVGSRVAAGQPLARVVLVKASLEVTAPAAGVLGRIDVAEGDSFARGQALAQLQPAP